MPNRAFSREGAWLFPPALEELVTADQPARYVAAFVAGLGRAAWCELGVAPEGSARGAPGYHPRALLGAWRYGFMDGVRSSRGLEAACRDRVPYLRLSGWQRPDHHTLWRFHRAHREAMRALLKRTVRVAVATGLVDLAVQAVDGTRVAGSAGRERTLDADGLAAGRARRRPGCRPRRRGRGRCGRGSWRRWPGSRTRAGRRGRTRPCSSGAAAGSRQGTTPRRRWPGWPPRTAAGRAGC